MTLQRTERDSRRCFYSSLKKKKEKTTKRRVRPLQYLSLMSSNNVAFTAIAACLLLLLLLLSFSSQSNAHIKVLSFLLWSFSLQSRGGKVSSCIVIRGSGFSIHTHTHKQPCPSQISDCEMFMVRSFHLISLIWCLSLTSGSHPLPDPCLYIHSL